MLQSAWVGDMRDAGVKVDVTPAGPEQLASTSSRGGSNRDGGGQDRLTAFLGAGDQPLYDLWTRDRFRLQTQRWRAGLLRDGGRHYPLFVGLIQRRGHNAVQVMNAPRMKTFVQPLPVGPVELLGRELRQLDLPEFRVDSPDLAPVAAHRRR
jgi:hypothetical protein